MPRGCLSKCCWRTTCPGSDNWRTPCSARSVLLQADASHALDFGRTAATLGLVSPGGVVILRRQGVAAIQREDRFFCIGRAACARKLTMHRPVSRQDLPRAQLLAERALATFERFTHIQAASGVVLLIAAAIALLWANSSFAPHYHALWHTPISLVVVPVSSSQSLHFWINDALMTLLFLVVGMEVRREIHEGSLTSLRQASLPIAAAAGGVILPALLYLSLNDDAIRQHG